MSFLIFVGYIVITTTKEEKQVNRKLLIGVFTGIVLFGGVVGVGALASEQENKQIKTYQADIKANLKKVDDDRIFDNRDDDFVNGQKQVVKITKDDAIKIATDNTPGEVVKVELDDSGYYEIDVVSSQSKVEYKIDANNGEILSKELDDDRSDD